MATASPSSNQEGEGPKLEDLLCGYSKNADEDNQSHHPVSNYHDMYFQSSNGLGINVNMPPSFNPDETRTDEDMHNSCHFLQAFHQPNHSFQEISTLKPQFFAPISNSNPNPFFNLIYNGCMDDSTSISGIKSWPRQNQYVPKKQLTEPTTVELKCLNAKFATREPVPRNSIETFGQRTS